MSADLYRLGREVGERGSVRHSWTPTYTEQPGRPRVVATAPQSDPATFAQLVACLEPPLHLLYVLHTPRGEGAPGRYQSPELDAGQVRDFLVRFDAFLRRDARYDLWAYSPSTRAQVVWDRHDRLFAYGPTDAFVAALQALGFAPGAEPVMDWPHVHHYHAACDADAAALLAWCEWHHTPLRPEDEQ
jgi:hypothetical protein